MELLAVIVALEALKTNNYPVVIHTDSKYVCEAVEKRWVFGWAQTDFKKKKNADLWKRFLQIYPKNKVSFKWIKGHAGHTENELCDRMATAAADNAQQHLIDTGFESGLYNS
jgi:ribonuclease HI